MVILMGAALVQNGMTKLFETSFNIQLSTIVPLHLTFLPNEDSIMGHLLQSFLGIDRELSGIRIAIMLIYIAVLYLLFRKARNDRFAASLPQPKP